jgi:hypothetical protein
MAQPLLVQHAAMAQPVGKELVLAELMGKYIHKI